MSVDGFYPLVGVGADQEFREVIGDETSGADVGAQGFGVSVDINIRGVLFIVPHGPVLSVEDRFSGRGDVESPNCPPVAVGFPVVGFSDQSPGEPDRGSSGAAEGYGGGAVYGCSVHVCVC